MNKIIYKTKPKLFFLIFPILGSIFCGEIFGLIWTASKNKINIVSLPFLILFATLSLLALINFLIINKTIVLTNENIIISYLFLPIKKVFSISEIKNISEITKDVNSMFSVTFSMQYLYTSTITTVSFLDNNQIKFRSIGEDDFKEFHNAFRKTKNNEGKIKKNRQSKLEYIGSNIDGIIWGILFLIVTIGLGHALLVK